MTRDETTKAWIEDEVLGGDRDIDTQEPTDVTDSRSNSTWEQNRTGTTLLVTVVGVQATVGNRLNLVADVNNLQSSNIVSFFDTIADRNTSNVTVTMMVPPNYYYRVRLDGTDSEVDVWHEQELGTVAE